MAYTTDDLFVDNLLGDPNDLDNLVEYRDNDDNSEADGNHERGEEADDKDGEDGEEKKDSDKKAEQKTVRIKRPQPKLDAERLKGPRGLKELQKSMSDVKFRGKRHEAEDLQQIMARVEHWSHRLFPKLQFDDFLEKVEKLGTKKVVQNYVRRMRMGLLDDEDESRPPNSDDEEAVDNPDPTANETMGEFDRLLAEQVSLHQNTSVSIKSPRTPAAGTPRTPAFLRPGQGVSSTPVPSLTAEQRARMEANRLVALERRRLRMEAAAAAAAAEQSTTTTPTAEQSTTTTPMAEQSNPISSTSEQPTTSTSPTTASKSPCTAISSDAAARMEANRLAAVERRRARMAAAAAAAAGEQSNTSTSTPEQPEHSTTSASTTNLSPSKEVVLDSTPDHSVRDGEAQREPVGSAPDLNNSSDKNNLSINSPSSVG